MKRAWERAEGSYTLKFSCEELAQSLAGTFTIFVGILGFFDNIF